jgi:hypothetical protein
VRLSFDRLWVGIALALPALLSLLVPLPAVDLAYQVRAGDEILAAGALPSVDTWTFTIAGTPWVDQQWLAQVLLSLGYRLGGWELLAVVRAALVVLALGLLLAACVAHGTPVRVAAVLVLVAFLLTAPALALRPQLFGIAIFAALLWLVAVRERRPRLYWFAPVLVVLWANIHGSFVLAPLVLGYAWLDDVSAGRPWRGSLVVLVAGALATLLNPFALDAWAYALRLGTDPVIREAVSEWQRTSPLTAPGALFYASVAAVALFVLWSRRRAPASVSWPDVAWLAGWALIGAWAERGLAWWPIAAAFAVAGILGRARATSATEPRREPAPNTLNGFVAVILGLVVVAALPWWRPADPLTGRKGLLSYAPSSLAQALLDSAPGGRVWAPQTWASWFEWAAPAQLAFLDSRFELYPSQVFASYGMIAAGGDEALAELATRGVDTVIAETNSRLAATLVESGWKLVHEDPDGVLYQAAR